MSKEGDLKRGDFVMCINDEGVEQYVSKCGIYKVIEVVHPYLSIETGSWFTKFYQDRFALFKKAENTEEYEPKPRSIKNLLRADNEIEKDRLGMFHSLCEAIGDAEGSRMLGKELLDMKLHEVIDILGQNGVRFCHVKKGD